MGYVGGDTSLALTVEEEGDGFVVLEDSIGESLLVPYTGGEGTADVAAPVGYTGGVASVGSKVDDAGEVSCEGVAFWVDSFEDTSGVP